MLNKEMYSIFEQINNLKKPAKEVDIADSEKERLYDVLKSVAEEIKRVSDENYFTQEELCRVTNMSQSNLSRIQNCKVIPRIETLNKIAEATHTRLVISFENTEGED